MDPVAHETSAVLPIKSEGSGVADDASIGSGFDAQTPALFIHSFIPDISIAPL